jgi:hypothetical protein
MMHNEVVQSHKVQSKPFNGSVFHQIRIVRCMLKVALFQQQHDVLMLFISAINSWQA